MIAALKRKFFGESSSKTKARSRLHFVLVQDRSGLTSEDMANFKSELVEVISKYFEIDKENFDVAYERDSSSTTLLINSPVQVKRKSKKHKKNKNGKEATVLEGPKPKS